MVMIVYVFKIISQQQDAAPWKKQTKIPFFQCPKYWCSSLPRRPGKIHVRTKLKHTSNTYRRKETNTEQERDTRSTCTQGGGGGTRGEAESPEGQSKHLVWGTESGGRDRGPRMVDGPAQRTLSEKRRGREVEEERQLPSLAMNFSIN